MTTKLLLLTAIIFSLASCADGIGGADPLDCGYDMMRDDNVNRF